MADKGGSILDDIGAAIAPQTTQALMNMPIVKAQNAQKLSQLQAQNKLMDMLTNGGSLSSSDDSLAMPTPLQKPAQFQAGVDGSPDIITMPAPPASAPAQPGALDMGTMIRAMGVQAIPALAQRSIYADMAKQAGLSGKDALSFMMNPPEWAKAVAAAQNPSLKDRFPVTRNGAIVDLQAPGGPKVAVSGVPTELKGVVNGPNGPQDQNFVGDVGQPLTPFGAPGNFAITPPSGPVGELLGAQRFQNAQGAGSGVPTSAPVGQGTFPGRPGMPAIPAGLGIGVPPPSITGAIPDIINAKVTALARTPEQQAAADESAKTATAQNYKLRDDINSKAAQADEDLPIFGAMDAARKIFTGTGAFGDLKADALGAIQSLVPQNVLDRMSGGDKYAAAEVIKAGAAKLASDLRSPGQRLTQQEIMSLYLPAAGGLGMPNNAATALFKQRIAAAQKWQKLRDTAVSYTDDNGAIKPGFYQAVNSAYSDANKTQNGIVSEMQRNGFNFGGKQPVPQIGDVVAGFRYKGGNPKQQSSWEAVK